MVQAIQISDDIRIQPYPYPIGGVTASTSSARNSTSASMRRMRTETTTMPTFTDIEEVQQSIEKLEQNLEMALKEGRYEDGVKLIEEFETEWNDHICQSVIDGLGADNRNQLVGIKPLVEHAGAASIDLMKSYFMALGKDQGAIEVGEEGFKELSLAIEKVLDIMALMGGEMDDGQALLYQDAFKMMGRGMIHFALGNKRESAADLRAFYPLYLKIMKWDNTSSSFPEEIRLDAEYFLRVLEGKLGEAILPVAQDGDSIRDLFLAGRYEEALELADFSNKGVCLAMLGRFDEALAIECISSEVKVMIYLQKGDLAAAKELILSNEDLFPFLLLV